MVILVTGSKGFVGKNLVVRLKEEGLDFTTFDRGDSEAELQAKIRSASIIVHLAGVNRPLDESEFQQGNTDLTKKIVSILQADGLKTPVIYSSSIQAKNDGPYGVSKKLAEDALLELSANHGNRVYNYRLPNVFGKWCKPNYNSAVATFCHNISHDLPVKINDPSAIINLVYIDDVVDEFVDVIRSSDTTGDVVWGEVKPVYQITVGDLSEQLQAFRDTHSTHITERVGCGLTRALYSTYLSYLEPEQFSYPLIKHEDARGMFVEMLKTKDSGQFSFFTAHPGITRGGHYHHTKNEKFLVIAGNARFRFRHILTDESYELETSGDEPQVVETVPGWSHDITNIGDKEMLVMLWANEIFDPQRPDTISHEV